VNDFGKRVDIFTQLNEFDRKMHDGYFKKLGYEVFDVY